RRLLLRPLVQLRRSQISPFSLALQQALPTAIPRIVTSSLAKRRKLLSHSVHIIHKGLRSGRPGNFFRLPRAKLGRPWPCYLAALEIGIDASGEVRDERIPTSLHVIVARQYSIRSQRPRCVAARWQCQWRKRPIEPAHFHQLHAKDQLSVTKSPNSL
ncbi:uncharacterized protein IWZ02DRAFT_400550, partial [Phyllosticta citriasiana]|uniref:uncharacterized protein n=1 Tax=Phyllosticta citriasiana TaxID=595635 RepID=UPI0030FDCF15